MKKEAQNKYDAIKDGSGFIAALDQSGSSTPRSLANYGISSESYEDDEEMLKLMHQYRTRIITAPCFTSDKILGAILYADTVSKYIDGIPSAKYLWDEKGIPSFAKVDNGLMQRAFGVQQLKSIPGLFKLINMLKLKGVSGIKMRSVIHEPNQLGISRLVKQQFQIANAALEHELIPIIEPEVLISSPDKSESDKILLNELEKNLAEMHPHLQVILKISIPECIDMYSSLRDHPNVMHLVALSGGYSQQEAADRLSTHHGMRASFSRALLEGLYVDQSDERFNEILSRSIDNIYKASTDG